MLMEDGEDSFLTEKTMKVMNDYPDVPFYQIQTSIRDDKHIMNKVKVFKNDVFDPEYVKVRGNQSICLLDGIKALVYGKKLTSMNEELRKGEYTSVKELLHMILPLYQTLYKEQTSGLFAVPSIIENDNEQYRFGVSAIIKYHDEEIHYLNTLIMDEIGFVEECDPGISWFMAEGVMEQADMPEELKKLFIQMNKEQQDRISEFDEFIQYGR